MAFIPSASTALTSSLSHICGAYDTTTTTTRSLPAVPHVQTLRSRRVTPVCATAAAPGRKFMVGGNWKCNLDKAKITELVDVFNAAPPLDASNIQVVVAPPAVYLESTRAALRSDFGVSAQNNWVSAGGAFTGEVDATMIKDVGADWVILGHSERRHLPQIKESDADIATKAKYAVKEATLNVMYCIGELLEEREAGNTFAVCQRQLEALKEGLGTDAADWSNIVIAYEPVWAIGTGKVATPEQAEEVHEFIRNWMSQNVTAAIAGATRILYGGSVSPSNCQDLAKKPNIDGFLVGGASLKPTFLEIIDSYKVAVAETV